MKDNTIVFSTDLIAKFVRAVEDAVGDDIREDIQRNNFPTHNSVPSRIWDILNKNLVDALDTKDCTIITTHRGPWEMLIVFEKNTRCIITFMREKRFAELQRNQRRRKRMHYVDMLSKQFNQDLLADQQLSLFSRTFSDEDQLAELVQILLHDLGSDCELVRHHVLVLFDAHNFQLTRIRAVMITPSLDIAQGCEQDWSQYISADESIIVEKVANPNLPQNQPTHGLELTAKAVNRKKNKPQKKASTPLSQQEV